jgi:hypothetical protein
MLLNQRPVTLTVFKEIGSANLVDGAAKMPQKGAVILHVDNFGVEKLVGEEEGSNLSENNGSRVGELENFGELQLGLKRSYWDRCDMESPI